MKYVITQYGNPVLREKATPIKEVDDAMRVLADDMLETMRAAEGVGLAAQQIDKTIAICVVDVPKVYDVDAEGNPLNPEAEMPLVLINPEITGYSPATETGDEGCLSFPGVSGPVPRSIEIDVQFLDRQGLPRELHLQGFVARAVQHEIDHLNGILFIDRMSAVKRITLSGRLKRMRRETQASL